MKRLLPLTVVLVIAVGCGSSHQASGPCKGGPSEVVLRALAGNGQPVTSAGMQLAAQIMTDRVDRIGVGSPKVTVAGDEITVQFGGLHDPTRNMSLVASTGELQFFDFEKDLASPTVRDGAPTPYPTLYSLLEGLQGQVKEDGGASVYYLFGAPETRSGLRPVLGGPDPTRKELLAPYSGKERPGMATLGVPANREVVSGPVATSATQPVKKSPDGRYWYLFNLPPPLSGSDLNESAITADISSDNGQPEVVLGFSSHGSKEFQAITKAEYQRGRLVAGLHGSPDTLNEAYTQHNAIVLDGKLEATPYIDYTQRTLEFGIVGNATISDMGSLKAAQNLALVLQTGSLPYTFQRVSLRICSP